MKTQKTDVPRFKCPLCDRPLSLRHRCQKCRRDFSAEVAEGLTKRQVDGQDEINEACAELIRQFVPDLDEDEDIGIDQAGTVRDALIEVLVEYHGLKEYDLCPWYLEPCATSGGGRDGGREDRLQPGRKRQREGRVVRRFLECSVYYRA